MLEKAEQLVEVFEGFRKAGSPNEDQFDSVGRQVLVEKVSAFMARSEPVEFVLSAFPMKSPNHGTKTLGDLPDGAEEVALRNFGQFAQMAAEVYEPGVIIRVIMDGYVFRDIIGVSEDVVQAYHDRCVEMAEGSPIIMSTLLDFYRDDLSVPTALQMMLDRFGDSEDQIKERIRNEEDVRMLYLGLTRFMTTDIVWPPGLSRTQIQKRAKRVAQQMLMRSEAYSRFITSHHPKAIRISCHPSTNSGAKYSWQFIPGNQGWNTPWHNVLCVVNGRYTLMNRADAEKQDLELVYKDGQPYYFRDKPSSADLV